jgi:hypothetical protein
VNVRQLRARVRRSDLLIRWAGDVGGRVGKAHSWNEAVSLRNISRTLYKASEAELQGRRCKIYRQSLKYRIDCFWETVGN